MTKRHRSSISGRFVAAARALAQPRTTTTEVVPRTTAVAGRYQLQLALGDPALVAMPDGAAKSLLLRIAREAGSYDREYVLQLRELDY